MCSRYTLVADSEALIKRFNLEANIPFSPLYNAAPADILPIVTQSAPKGLSNFYWGLPPEWAKQKSVSIKLINAPVEQLLSKSSYKNALESRRCIVPADGFYAWKQVGKKTKIPYRFVQNDESLFSFAGIWEEFEGDQNGELYHTFMIITCVANKGIVDINDRMPVILTSETEKTWLNHNSTMEELMELLVPYPHDKINGYTVSNRIDIVGENSPLLIKPSKPVDQHGNYSLFG